jgi:hypothetical protein
VMEDGCVTGVPFCELDDLYEHARTGLRLMCCTRLAFSQVERLREVMTPANCGLRAPLAWAAAG